MQTVPRNNMHTAIQATFGETVHVRTRTEDGLHGGHAQCHAGVGTAVSLVQQMRCTMPHIQHVRGVRNMKHPMLIQHTPIGHGTQRLFWVNLYSPWHDHTAGVAASQNVLVMVQHGTAQKEGSGCCARCWKHRARSHICHA